MKPSKVATVYARDENGKILARGRVSNLAASHVESVKRALLEQVGTMVLRRQIEPLEVDIDDSEVVEARRKEAGEASKLSEDEDHDPAFRYQMLARAHELVAAHLNRSDLSRQFELKRQPAPAAAPAAVEAIEDYTPHRRSSITRALRKIFRGGK